MKKQTAVEWLFEQFENGNMYNVEDAQRIKYQALVMEKLQIVDAFNSGDFMHHYKIDIDKDNNMILQLSAFFHSGGNNKIALLKDNPVLQDLLMKAIQIESQKMFRKTVHGILGIPYGLKEND